MTTSIKILKAFHGDCILIRVINEMQQEFTILIDGGTSKTFDFSLKKELRSIKKINLFVLTHIDSDHIGGILRFVKDSIFQEIDIDEFWINGANLAYISMGGNISYNQGQNLEKLLIEKGIFKEKIISNITTNYKPVFPDFINIDILSPTPEILQNLYDKWPKQNLKNIISMDIVI